MKFLWMIFVVFLIPCLWAQSQEEIKPWKTIPKHAGDIAQVAVSPVDKLFAFSLLDQNVYIHSLETGELVRILSSHNDLVKMVAFSPDGKILASASADHTAILWGVHTGQIIFRLAEKHSKALQCLAFSPDGKVLATGGADSLIVLWNVETGKVLQTLSGHTNEIRGLTFSPDAIFLFSVGQDNTLLVWKIQEIPAAIVQNPSSETDKTREFFERGNMYKAKGEFEKAIAEFSMAIEKDPKYALAHYQLGATYSLRAQSYPETENLKKEADIAKAIESLGRAFSHGYKDWETVKQDSSLVPLQSEERYKQLLETYVQKAFKSDEEKLVKSKDMSENSKPISFKILEEDGVLTAMAHEIIVNGKTISPKDKFFPGYSYDMIVKFLEYKTVRRNVYLDGAEHAFTLRLPLSHLRTYTFFTEGAPVELDGIVYPYQLYADNTEIESHHIENSLRAGKNHFTIQVDPMANQFRLVAGYFYTEKPFIWLREGIKVRDRLSIPLLIKHLDAVAKNSKEGYRASMVALEKLLQNRSLNERIKYSAITDLSQLVNAILEWNLEEEQDMERTRELVKALEDFINFPRTKESSE